VLSDPFPIEGSFEALVRAGLGEAFNVHIQPG